MSHADILFGLVWVSSQFNETFVICGFLFCVDTLFGFGFLITSMMHCRSQGLILQVWYNRSRCMGLIRLITLLIWTGFIIPPWNISDEIGFSHHTSWYFWSAWGFLSRWNITFSYCGFKCCLFWHHSIDLDLISYSSDTLTFLGYFSILKHLRTLDLILYNDTYIMNGFNWWPWYILASCVKINLLDTFAWVGLLILYETFKVHGFKSTFSDTLEDCGCFLLSDTFHNNGLNSSFETFITVGLIFQPLILFSLMGLFCLFETFSSIGFIMGFDTYKYLLLATTYI